MAIGDTCINNVVSFKDEEFGYKIIKPIENDLTRTLYFTSNPFCSDNEHIIVSAVKNGAENLYILNFITGRMTQLTDSEKIKIEYSCFDRKRNHLYYSTQHELRRVDIYSLKDEVLFQSNKGMGSFSITCDGRYAVTTCAWDYTYANNVGQKITCKMDRMFKVELESAEESHILYRSFEIDHVQCSPAEPDEVVFCSKGYFAGNHRIWKTNLSGTRGGALGPEQPNEHRTHEYFTPSGRKIAYHGKFFITDENYKFKKVLDTFGIMRTDGTEDKYYKCPKGFTPFHSCMSKDEKLIICDGKDYLSILLLNDETMEVEYKNIYRHSSSMRSNFVHPHPSISPNGRYVVFATDRGGKDRGSIYLLDLYA